MYYVTTGNVIWSAHRSTEAAFRSKTRLEAMGSYVFGIHAIDGKWAKGDTPAPRYFGEVIA